MHDKDKMCIRDSPDIDRMLVSLQRNKGELLGNYVKLTMTDCREIYRLAF